MSHLNPTPQGFQSPPTDWFKWVVGGSLAVIACAALLFIASCGLGLFGLSQAGSQGIDSAFVVGNCNYIGNYVSGDITNTSNETIGNVSADISVFDFNGSVAGSTTAFTNQVAPGQTWRFREFIGYVPGGVSAKVTSVSGF